MPAAAPPRALLPLSTLLASAARITSATVTRRGASAEGWQDDAWDMFDLVGEQRFLATTLAGRLGQARFFVGEMVSPEEPPEPTANAAVAEVLTSIGSGSPAAFSQIITRLGVNLFVAGEGWLVGLPNEEAVEDEDGVLTPTLPGLPLDLSSLDWRMLSASEVSVTGAGDEIVLHLGDTAEEQRRYHPDDIFLIRIWRPHPRRWWEADSPTRSSLPVLRELVGLTKHVSAQIDSRLAGAGVLFVPHSAQRALKAEIAAMTGRSMEDLDREDPFTEALLEAMLQPIRDRSSASALVPLVITVPDESIALFRHLAFGQPLDAEARELRDEAIRRLALGQDAPPELLLGTAGMNHWGAWLVKEDVVQTHLEPSLALIADALTTQYLWPVLLDQGMPEEQARRYVVWYTVDHLIARPSRAEDAFRLQERGVLSDVSLRDAAGFSEVDAPAPSDLAAASVLRMIEANPALLADPGADALLDQVTALLAGRPLPALESVATPAPPPAPTPTPEEEEEEEEEAPAPEGPPTSSSPESAPPSPPPPPPPPTSAPVA